MEPRKHSDYVRRPRFRVALVLVAATGATAASASPYPARPAAIHEADGCRRTTQEPETRALCNPLGRPDLGDPLLSHTKVQVEAVGVISLSDTCTSHNTQFVINAAGSLALRATSACTVAPRLSGADSEPIDSLIRVVTTSVRRLTLSGCVAGTLMQASGCGRGTGSRRASGSQRPAPCVLTM
jgi:hypothetical protein